MSDNSCDRDDPITTPPSHASSPEKFQQRLAALNQVTMALTRSSSIDDLYHMAVKLGIRDLAFDRLGLFLVDPTDPYRLTGTYGTDRTGQVVVEQHVTFRLQAGDWLLALVSGQTSSLYMVADPVTLLDSSADHKPEVVGTGWNAGAALWDGEEIIGYLLADNLLRQQCYTEFDGELLALYAGTIGHLCLRLRSEELLRNSHKLERNFRTRLAKLNGIAAQLMRVPDLDTLYRSVIELGRHELGFDRLGLWLYAENREMLVGTYGTWLDGTLKDERHLTVAAASFESQVQTRADDTQGIVHHPNIALTTPETNAIGYGWSATAVLSDGEKVIGYLSADNLLEHLPYHEIDGELLKAYAHMIGPLITRQRSAQQLRERQANYQALLNAIPDMLFILTREGIYQDYYAPTDELLYAPPTFFLGKHVSMVLPLSIAQQVMDAIAQLATAGDCITLNFTLPFHEQIRFYDARLVQLGQDLILTLVRDVTDRKRLEEQLLVLQKMESLGRMASGIAHDFNNILTIVQGYSSLVQWQLDENQPKLNQALIKILDATEKGMHLTQQLLSFARKQVIAPQVVDAQAMIRSLETMLHQVLGDEVALRLQLTEVPLLIKIDPGQLEQIILNLTVNARDAMSKGDTLSIGCRQVSVDEAEAKRHLGAAPGTYVLIEVADTGAGIPEELLKNIFEPFFSTKPGRKGSGLGLAICHGIVQQRGGHIRVESTLSEGTIFQIFLPAIQGEAKQIIPADPSAHAAGGETILIVEDDPIVCALATDILRSHGYAVFACTSGKDALQRVQEHPGRIDLLMTDMMMPQMSGQELAEAMMRLYPNLPVLMVSGYVGELPEQFLQIPNVKFLTKPYKANELAAHVRAILHQQT